MSKDAEYIIADLGPIRENGIEFFIENCSWPVSEDDFRSLSNFLRDTYIDLLLSLEDDFLFKFGQIELNFVVQLMHIMHYNYVKNYADHNQKKIILGGDAKVYIDPNWNHIGNYYSKHMCFPFGKTKRIIRRFAKNIIFNKHLGIFGLLQGLFGSKSVISIGSNDHLKREYIQNSLIFCDHMDWPDLIGEFESKKIDLTLVNIFDKQVIQPFIKTIKNNKGLFSHGLAFDDIALNWRKRAIDLYGLIETVHCNGKAKTLLVTEAAKPYSKAISLGLSQQGVKVIHFSHGNEAGLLNQQWLHQSVISHANKYVFETDVIQKRFQYSHNNRPIENRTNTTFYSVGSKIYEKLRNKKIKRGKYNKVMLMGHPMNLYRDPDESQMFFNQKIYLEYKILSALNNTDAIEEVTYKAHPDRLSEIKGLYEPYVDNIIVEKFESITKDDTILIFTSVASTTFCYAINLQVPIVLINVKGTPWHDNMNRILEERVSYVDCYYDDGVPYFKENDLTKALTDARLKINMNVSKSITG